MVLRPPMSTRTDTLFPYTTLFRAHKGRITAGDVMRVDMHGMPLDGRSPSAETLLHVLIYRPKRSEEHTSELQSIMRISYGVFCLKKKYIQYLQSRPIHCLT